METLAEQPTLEKQKSFDPLASVDMLGYDLERFGQVLPETRERVCDEELSFLAEGVDRAARTAFVLKRQGDELKYFNRGQWRPYMSMLVTGLQVAEREAADDSRRSFLAEWRNEDLMHGYKLGSLQPGQQHAWYSSYDHEAEARYGQEFMDSCGLVSDRKMGFLYHASCLEDGSVRLESQTIDGSDQDAFDAAMAVYETEPQADLDDLMLGYDGVMTNKYDAEFFAGRRDAEIKENAWQIIQEQRDLIEYHLNELETIAALELPRDELERVAKEHVYGVWAAFKKRLDGTAWSPQSLTASPQRRDNLEQAVVIPWNVGQEVRYAFQDFASKGEVLVGCGGSISVKSAKDDIMNASSEDVFSSIFGGSSKLSALEKKVGKITKGKCVVESCPTRPGEVKIGGCGVCLDRCQKLFDKGRDPTKMAVAGKKVGPKVTEFVLLQADSPKTKKADTHEVGLAA